MSLKLLTMAVNCLTWSFLSTDAQSITTGPRKGSLVIVGGGKVGVEIINRFVDLAGRKQANMVVIPTAFGQNSYQQNVSLAPVFKAEDIKNVTVLHAKTKDEANQASFNSILMKGKWSVVCWGKAMAIGRLISRN